MTKRIRISNESLNCYGTWVKTSGIDLSQFERNPVLLYMHRRGVIIGCIKDIRVEGDEITGEPYFDEVREESKLAKQQWEKDTLRMGSPNFEVIETSEDLELFKPGQRYATITKSKLIEYSMVDIGGNDDNIRLEYQGKELKLSHDGTSALPMLKTNTNNNNQNNTQMNDLKTIALMLGLAESATLVEVQKKINLLLEFEKANAQLRTQLDDKQKELDGIKLAGITTMVDNAVTIGKITADKKEHFMSLGKQIGAESLKLTFDAMLSAVKPSTVLNRPNVGGAPGSYKKLSEVPAEQLELMRSEDPNQYKQLYKAEYGIECPELK